MRKKAELSSKSHNGWTDERGPVNRVAGSRSIGQGTRWETVQSRGVPVFHSALEPTALRAAAQRPESLYGPTERSRLMTSKIIGIELRFDGDGTVRQVGKGG